MIVGKTYGGKDVFLSDADLRTHLYGAGKSQRGKTRFITLLVRELIKAGKGVCLIDPHSNIPRSSYEGVLNWLAYVRPRYATVNLLDPSTLPTGFNPFTLQGERTEASAAASASHASTSATGAGTLSPTTHAPDQPGDCRASPLDIPDVQLEADSRADRP
jgi:DNA helicase HerA-like ATPase